MCTHTVFCVCVCVCFFLYLFIYNGRACARRTTYSSQLTPHTFWNTSAYFWEREREEIEGERGGRGRERRSKFNIVLSMLIERHVSMSTVRIWISLASDTWRKINPATGRQIRNIKWLDDILVTFRRKFITGGDESARLIKLAITVNVLWNVWWAIHKT